MTDRETFDRWPGVAVILRAFEQADPVPFVSGVPDGWQMVTLVRRDGAKRVYLAQGQVKLTEVSRMAGPVSMLEVAQLMVDRALVRAD